MIYGEMPSCTMTNALEDFLKVRVIEKIIKKF